jgi:hypothetical protein
MDLAWRGKAVNFGFAVLALAAMLGCQGMGAGRTSNGNGGTPGSLTVSSPSLSFGSVHLGNTLTKSETLTNAGGSSVTISQATASGSDFSVSGLSLPLSLAAGQSVTFNASFAPHSAGAISGIIAVASNASNSTLNVSLSGTGVTPGALAANPSNLSFGIVQVGSSQTKSATLTNSGGSSVTISEVAANGASFSVSGLNLPVTLTAGQSVTLSVSFAPQSAGSASGSLAVASNASNPSLNVSLSGSGVTAGLLAANPSNLSFGSVQVGASQTRSETLTNSGNSSVTISQAVASGASFSLSGLSLPLALAAGQSFTFSVSFTPRSAGTLSGNVTVVSNASNSSLTVGLAGTGASPGQLAVSPLTLSFGSVIVGTSAIQNALLSASGVDVTVSSASSSSSEFTLGVLSFPFTLAAGQNLPFTVTFIPQLSGATSGSVSFVSNAANSPTSETVVGAGVPSPAHSVDLSWDASVSQVAGYNVYRGGQSGGPYTQINSSLEASTSYTDRTVHSGNTYYYVVTAVDPSGNESSFSNQIRAVIPSP